MPVSIVSLSQLGGTVILDYPSLVERVLCSDLL